MTSIRYRSSLQARFHLAVAGLFLVTVVGSLLALGMTANDVLTSFARRLAVKQALLERNKIVSVIDRELALARALASDPAVVRWIGNEQDAAARNGALEQLEHYRVMFKDKSFFVATGETRSYYAFDGSNAGMGLQMTPLNSWDPKDRWYFYTMAQVKDYALNLDYDRVFNSIKVWLNVMVKDQAGKVIGIAGGGIDISAFIKDITYLEDKEITSIVIDRAGVIQAHPDISIMVHNGRASSDAEKITINTLLKGGQGPDKLENALERLASGQSEVESFPVSVDGGRYLAAVTAMPGLSWYNLVLVDIAGAAGSGIYWPMVALVVLSLLLVLVAVSLLLRRMVLSPLGALTQAAGEMAMGRYEQVLPVSGDDEIGRLSESFNRMAGVVQDHTRNLEDKVRERTAELSTAYENLDQSRQRMLESLRYARAIQRSILPREDALDAAFSQHMSLYLPRDIVGGDLTYFRKVDQGFLFGVVDCTGHGVPGAFMSMTVHTVLNHVAAVVVSDDPARILAETNAVLRATLGMDQAGEEGLDCGLEIALCLCMPHKDTVVFAGAGISLHVLQDGELRVIRADRRTVGYRETVGPKRKDEWKNHVLENVRGARFYATTDGFLDEGGGERGFGFGAGRFGKMLLDEADLPMREQAGAFEAVLRRYRGTRKQRDDITVIGFSL